MASGLPLFSSSPFFIEFFTTAVGPVLLVAHGNYTSVFSLTLQ